MCPSTLLIVDDDSDFAAFVSRTAVEAGFEVRVTTNGEDCLSELSRSPADVVVSDLQMPDMDGVRLMRRFSLSGIRSRLILASGVDARTLATARRLAIEHGLDVAGTIQKPVRLAEIRNLLKSLVAEPHADADVSERTLADAIERGELKVAYQPVIDLRSRAMTGVEALARWTLSSGMPVPADRFISLAETSGLIDQLTYQVVGEALRQLGEWDASGLALTVAVNVSVASLHDLDFPDKLADLCATAGQQPDRVRVELTETAAMRTALPMMDILTRIRLKGFELSLDDFGVGYSSLRQLQRLPFSELKIDRSFVGDLEHARDSAVITKTIIDMAHNLGLSVVAEGIEDGTALALLDQFGCDFGQGYLFSRPVPGGEIATAARSIDDVLRSQPAAESEE